MKKLIALILVALMSVACFACAAPAETPAGEDEPTRLFSAPNGGQTGPQAQGGPGFSFDNLRFGK